jgi:hypothetical protein
LQLLLGQGQVLPRNRLLCCPALKSSSAAARLNTLHVTHKALRSCPIHAPGRRHVTATPSALPAAATAATAAFSPWSTLAVLCSCAAAAQIVEDHTSWGKLLSAPLLTLLLALGAAALGLLPPTSAVYDIVWSHLMPLAIALFLLDHDVSNIRTVGGPVLASFLLGAGEGWICCFSRFCLSCRCMFMRLLHVRRLYYESLDPICRWLWMLSRGKAAVPRVTEIGPLHAGLCLPVCCSVQQCQHHLCKKLGPQHSPLLEKKALICSAAMSGQLTINRGSVLCCSQLTAACCADFKTLVVVLVLSPLSLCVTSCGFLA